MPESVDMIGSACFMDFLCAIFSRIAYTEDPLPIYLVSGVFRIFPKELIITLSQITSITDLKDDTVLLQKADTLYPKHTIPIRVSNKLRYVDFMPYVPSINELIENTDKSKYYEKETDPNIKIISIADSNYGDTLVICTKYVAFMWLAFRGTYSTKTAQSYIQLSSLIPAEIDEGTKLLKGIAKIEYEIIHTIFAAMKVLVKDFLPNKNVIPVITGHSLGGGLATIFGNEYCNLVAKYGESFVAPLNSKPICISFGSPRVLSKGTSERLCQHVVSDRILFHRFSNDADPVTSLPPPGIGFYHPCSSSNDKAKGNRALTSRDCKSPMTLIPLKLNLNKPINCRTTESSLSGRVFGVGPSPLHHVSYLYVSFIQAADIVHLLAKSALTINTTEIGRVKATNSQFSLTQGDSEMRIVQMTGNGNTGIFTVGFVDLVTLRKTRGPLKEDSVMHETLFLKLLDNTKFKQEISFDAKGMPVSFPKSIKDDSLADNDQYYRNELNSTGDNSFVDAAPSDVAPSDVAPTYAAPSDVAPSDVAPTDAAPSDAAPSDVAPSDVAPTDAAPSDAAPSDVAPTDVAPTDVAPTDAAPSDAAPAETSTDISAGGRKKRFTRKSKHKRLTLKTNKHRHIRKSIKKRR
jgi:hypothetical protein